jgi:hypothetical protein
MKYSGSYEKFSETYLIISKKLEMGGELSWALKCLPYFIYEFFRKVLLSNKYLADKFQEAYKNTVTPTLNLSVSFA